MGGRGSGGRNRLPTSMKAARGTLRPCRMNSHEPTAGPGIPEMPTGLDAVERAEWRATAEQFLAMGVMDRGHGDALTQLVRSRVRFRRCAAKVRELGEVLTDQKGSLYRNPWAIAAEKAADEWRRSVREFGGTPASAGAVRAVPPRNDDSNSPANEFFGHARRGPTR